jgi:hypothetical protein
MVELILVGFSGTLVGAGLSATKRRAPLTVTRALYVLAGVALVLAIISFHGPRS